MIFGIDINKMVKWLMPHFLFKPVHYAWLKLLLFPMTWTYSQFLVYRLDKLKEATINSQVNRLRLALRERFGSDLIDIIHFSDYLNQAYIYLEIEGATLEYDYLEMENHQPVDYDYLTEEYDQEFDFVVRIPQSLAAQWESIIAFVNKYKLVGKRFTLEFI